MPTTQVPPSPVEQPGALEHRQVRNNTEGKRPKGSNPLSSSSAGVSKQRHFKVPPQSPPAVLQATRRNALVAASLGLMATAAACSKPSAPANQAPSKSIAAPSPTGPKPAPVSVSGKPGSLRLPAELDIMHLVQRATYGPTPQLLAEVKKQGAQAWLAAQLAPQDIPDPSAELIRKSFPKAFEVLATSMPKRAAEDGAKRGDKILDHLRFATTAQAMFSSRQLHERMTGFWIDHFNVSNGKKALKLSQADYVITIRKYALGRFGNLLQAVAEHPAMLSYLDGFDNRAGRPNENFAREVMELHTLGVGGGYSEEDVIAAAKLLTGWRTVKNPAEQTLSSYDPKKHAVGPVKILEFRSANGSAKGGIAEMRKFYSYLSKHPNTAKYLCQKLATVFVSDDPPVALVERMAKVYLDSDTEMVPVLSELFSSPEFAAAAGQKTRRPREYVVSAFRAMGAKPSGDLAAAFKWISQANPSHEPFAWATPDGYPLVNMNWLSAGISLEKFNTMSRVVGGNSPAISGLGLPGPEKLVSASANNVDAVVGEFTQRWFGRPAAGSELKSARILATKNDLPLTFSSPAERSLVAKLVGTLLLHSPSLLAC